MSMPNSGSVTPNAVECRNCCTVSQSPCAARPAIRPTSSGMPIPNSRSREMITVRYRAIGSSGPDTGTKTGRNR